MPRKDEMSSSARSRVSPTKETRETVGNACCANRHVATSPFPTKCERKKHAVAFS